MILEDLSLKAGQAGVQNINGVTCCNESFNWYHVCFLPNPSQLLASLPHDVPACIIFGRNGNDMHTKSIEPKFAIAEGQDLQFWTILYVKVFAHLPDASWTRDDTCSAREFLSVLLV